MSVLLWSRVLALLGVVAVPATALAQSPSSMRPLFNSDSITASMGTLSPNGRWLLIAISNPSQGTSLWTVPAGGGTPTRLTSDGFTDAAPVWFLRSDRIAFTSNRANRNGDRKSYVMVLDVDSATGRSVGVPRQISSEPVKVNGFPSADGRWITYVTVADGKEQLKIIPTTGGMPRVLAAREPAIGAVHFSRDGRFVYYSGSFMEGGRRTFTLKRVAVTGGRPELLVSTDHTVRTLPADNRYVVHTVAGNTNPGLRFEVRTLDGKVAARVIMPGGVGNPIFSGDGWGLMGVRRPWTSAIHAVTVDGAENRVVIQGGAHWPEAWMPDGKALVTDRRESGRILAEIVPLTGGTVQAVPLPPETGHTGWNGSVGPYFSYRTFPSPVLGMAGYVLHSIDLRSGGTRRLSTRAVASVGISGRGGMENDGPHWVIAEQSTLGGPLDIRSIDPATGNSRLIRTIEPGPHLARRGGFAVHDDRIAFLEHKGDSLHLLMTEGSEGPARRLGSWQVRSDEDYNSPTWSWSGNRIALPVAYQEGGRRSRIVVIEVPKSPAEPVRQRVYEPGEESTCENNQWLPDESAIVMICWRGSIPTVVKLGLADARFTMLATGTGDQGPWEILVSPTGRHVAYPMQTWRGSTVSVLDLKPLLANAP